MKDKIKELAIEAGFILQHDEYVFNEMIKKFFTLAQDEAFEEAALRVEEAKRNWLTHAQSEVMASTIRSLKHERNNKRQFAKST